MNATTLRHIPAGVIRAVLGAAYTITAVTALANFGHGRTLAKYAGQDAGQAILAAAIPDVLIAVSITVLAFRPRLVWAWASLAASIGFVFWAAVVTSLAGFCLPGTGECHGADPSNPTRILVAVWPLLAAVLLAGLVASFAHRPTVAVHLADDEGRTPEVHAGPPAPVPLPVLVPVPEYTPGPVPESAPGRPVPAPAVVAEYTPPASVSALRRTPRRTSTTADITEPEQDHEGKTDDQITKLMLTQEALPSIRAAKKTYGISQERAQRLIKEAREKKSEGMHEDHQLETREENKSKPDEQSHLGTTSEVGDPSAARPGIEHDTANAGDIP